MRAFRGDHNPKLDLQDQIVIWLIFCVDVAVICALVSLMRWQV